MPGNDAGVNAVIESADRCKIALIAAANRTRTAAQQYVDIERDVTRAQLNPERIARNYDRRIRSNSQMMSALPPPATGVQWAASVLNAAQSAFGHFQRVL